MIVLWVKRLNGGSLEENAANGVLALIAAACTLLDKQIKAQAEAFKNEDGFTERLYQYRQSNRK